MQGICPCCYGKNLNFHEQHYFHDGEVHTFRCDDCNCKGHEVFDINMKFIFQIDLKCCKIKRKESNLAI